MSARVATAIDTDAMGGQPQPDLLAEYVARVVAEAPPLTQEQRDRLALLLRDRQVA
ncbi:MAG: hypothetical protein ACR2JG_10250 [Geodermatophilaceae bacterium]